MKIAVAGTGYVGLSNAILLSQNNQVYAVDIIQEKVEMINRKESPIVDKEIEEYLKHRNLNLIATQMQHWRMPMLILLSFPHQPIMIRRKTISILLLLRV